MIYGNSLKMLLTSRKYELQEGEIAEIAGSAEKKYNPFTVDPSLYRRFSALNTDSDSEILEFIQTFGLLGLNTLIRDDSRKYLNKRLEGKAKFHEEVIEKIKKSYTDYLSDIIITFIKNPISGTPDALEHFVKELKDKFKVNLDIVADTVATSEKSNPLFFREALENLNRPKKEKIHDIKIEIKKMNIILKLWNSISFGNVLEIQTATYNLEVFNADTLVTEIFVDKLNSFVTYNEALFKAKIVLTNSINAEIKHVRPRLEDDSIDEFSDNPNNTFKGNWFFPDLLSAMYIMIYMDLIEGKRIRKCKNETCNEWFEIYGDDTRKFYCTNTCANTQCRRNVRKLEKQEKIKRKT